MSATVQGSNLLDGLKKKMRQTKEEMEKYKDECEEFQKRLQLETRRREEVRIAGGGDQGTLVGVVLSSSSSRLLIVRNSIHRYTVGVPKLGLIVARQPAAAAARWYFVVFVGGLVEWPTGVTSWKANIHKHTEITSLSLNGLLRFRLEFRR